MDEVDLRVHAETNRLLQRRTGVVATVILLGIVAGVTTDLVLGHFFDYEYRQFINLFGFIGMASVIYLSRSPAPPLQPRTFALLTSFAFCVFMLAMSADAGPEASTVVVVAYTVMNLGAATLLPWGVKNQAALVGMVLVSIGVSNYMLDRPLVLDSSVAVAVAAGLLLSLYIAHYLEQTRRLLARQRYDLELQKAAAEKQRAIAEEQREMAEALAHDLDAYAHAVAHDLKNPIQVIAGYTDLLSDKVWDDLDEEGRDFLERTATGCAKMTQIINELLLLASVRRQGKVPCAPLDMGSVVAEARGRLSEMIQIAGAKVVEPEEWPQALGHAPWIEEVWANYISNAIKYGGDPPLLEFGAQSNGNGKVHFWLRDNGAGMNDSEFDNLFEEFSRTAGASTDGHGLGLSIVKHIVERLAGDVSVSSAEGQGSTFGFTLPR